MIPIVKAKRTVNETTIVGRIRDRLNSMPGVSLMRNHQSGFQRDDYGNGHRGGLGDGSPDLIGSVTVVVQGRRACCACGGHGYLWTENMIGREAVPCEGCGGTRMAAGPWVTIARGFALEAKRPGYKRPKNLTKTEQDQDAWAATYRVLGWHVEQVQSVEEAVAAVERARAL